MSDDFRERVERRITADEYVQRLDQRIAEKNAERWGVRCIVCNRGFWARGNEAVCPDCVARGGLSRDRAGEAKTYMDRAYWAEWAIVFVCIGAIIIAVILL